MGYPRPKPKHLAAKLRAIREELGLTHSQMAKRLGTRSARIYDFESGSRESNLMILLRYARLADISTDVLIDDQMEL